MSEASSVKRLLSGMPTGMDTRTKLRHLCNERGWSQAEMLRQAGEPITASTYSAYLKSDKTDLTLGTAVAFAKAFNVDLGWLADDEQDMPPRTASAGAIELSEQERELLRIAKLLGYDRALGRMLGMPVAGDFGPLK